MGAYIVYDGAQVCFLEAGDSVGGWHEKDIDAEVNKLTRYFERHDRFRNARSMHFPGYDQAIEMLFGEFN